MCSVADLQRAQALRDANHDVSPINPITEQSAYPEPFYDPLPAPPLRPASRRFSIIRSVSEMLASRSALFPSPSKNENNHGRRGANLRAPRRQTLAHSASVFGKLPVRD
jgi:hypothetical protein